MLLLLLLLILMMMMMHANTVLNVNDLVVALSTVIIRVVPLEFDLMPSMKKVHY